MADHQIDKTATLYNEVGNVMLRQDPDRTSENLYLLAQAGDGWVDVALFSIGADTLTWSKQILNYRLCSWTYGMPKTQSSDGPRWNMKSEELTSPRIFGSTANFLQMNSVLNSGMN